MSSEPAISLLQVGASVGSGVIAALATAGSLIGWLLRRIDAVRANSEEKIEAVRLAGEAAIEKLRNEVVGHIEAHRRDYREDRIESQKWREGVLSSMVTRPEMDRLIDRQTDDLLERLDARVKPLLERGH